MPMRNIFMLAKIWLYEEYILMPSLFWLLDEDGEKEVFGMSHWRNSYIFVSTCMPILAEVINGYKSPGMGGITDDASGYE